MVSCRLTQFNHLHIYLVIWYSIPPVQKSSSFLANNPVHGKIVGVGSVESSFLFQATRCIDSYDHPDLAPLMVFLECLTTLEVSSSLSSWSSLGEQRRERFGPCLHLPESLLYRYEKYSSLVWTETAQGRVSWNIDNLTGPQIILCVQYFSETRFLVILEAKFKKSV